MSMTPDSRSASSFQLRFPFGRLPSTSLSDSVNALLPALEQFNRFDRPDLAGPERTKWRRLLDQPLPERAQGLEPWWTICTRSSYLTARTLALPASRVGSRLPQPLRALSHPWRLPSRVLKRYWANAYNFLETVALRWLCELLGLDPKFQGLFASGGAVANLVALSTARQYAFERLSIDLARDGMPEMHRWRVYASSEVHHAIFRAAGILGLLAGGIFR